MTAKRPLLILGICFFLLSGFFAVQPVHAQNNVQQAPAPQVQAASGVSPIWRGVEIFALVAALVCLGLFIYSAIVWRNATQSNDILGAERGRNLTILFGGLFLFFAILLLISFLVVRRQQQQAQAPQQVAETTGVTGLQTKNSLLLVDAVPRGKTNLQNTAVQMLFNQEVNQTNLESSVLVIDNDTNQPLRGTWMIDGEYAIFSPSQTCPAPDTDKHCFEANHAYSVSLNAGLRSQDGDPFHCSLASSSSDCSFNFITGEEIDSQDPTSRITAPYDQQAVSADSVEQVEAVGNDDRQLVALFYYVDGNRIGISMAASDNLQQEFRASTVWDTTGLDLNSTHQIQVVAYDLAANTGRSPAISVQTLPIACFDGEQNQDETGVDCGGASCRTCQGGTCSTNADCASGLCFNGVCQDFPVIEEVIASDGAPGNLITIRGKNFGTDPGQVIFLGDTPDSDNVTAPAPPCDLYWSDSEVVAIVPDGAVTGPLRIETSQNLFDQTDDNKGVRLDFTVDDVKRPGLCAVQPDTQYIGESIQLLGVGFGTDVSEVDFGQFKATSVDQWTDTSIGSVTVPSIDLGPTTILVKVGDETSNPLDFTVDKSPTLPFIDAITPDRGPVGQIFTLKGEYFTSAALVKFSNPRTGDTVLADTSLPKSCQNYQSDKQRAYRVPRLDPGVYQVFVETDKGESNAVDFTVTTSGKLPGLCGLSPDNGPLGTEVTLSGEGFGSTQSQVRFNPRIDDAQIQKWSDEQVVVLVPPNAQSGPVQVIDQKGNLSNSLDFTIGTCSPDTCSEGTVCCANGACQQSGTCSQSVPYCSYSWVFSTGDDLGGPPRVIEDASCKSNTQSPSPFKESKDGCLSAQISARFTHDMDDATITNDNIVVQKCNSGALLDSSKCSTGINLSTIQIINAGQPGEGFVAQPQLPLDPDTWYQVTLGTGLMGQNGLALPAAYRWNFKTQIGDGACAVDHVQVTPPTATLNELFQKQAYSAVPTALNCNILKGDDFEWSWLSSDTSKARTEQSTNSNNSATAAGPTDPGPPVQVIAGIPKFNLSDAGLLTIKLAAPTVVDKWPNCSSACVNAVVGAKFDQEMNDASVTSAQNVQLFKCADKACSKSSQSPVTIANLKYSATDSSLFFSPSSGGLESGATYRVVLKGLTSKSGLGLGGLNYDSGASAGLDSYSWIFSVQDQPDLCRIASVDVVPPFAISSLIGEKFDYISIPKATSDACSKDGQRLNPDSYDWSWASKDQKIAEVTKDDTTKPDGLIDPYQTATSKGPGNTKIDAGTQGVTGEGDFTMVCGFKNDSDCPAPATVETYGVGSNSCCFARPVPKSINPPDGSDSVCTTLATEIQFGQLMDESSLRENTHLEQDFGANPCPGTQQTAWQGVKGFFHKALALFVPETHAQAQNWCLIDSSVTVTTNEMGSKATIFPKAKLTPNTTYRIHLTGDANISDGVNEGVRNFYGVAMNGDQTSTFTTGTAECSLDIVDVVIDPPGEQGIKDVFSCAVRNDCPDDVDPQTDGNQHTYHAVGRDRHGFAIPAEFTWAPDASGLVTLDQTTGDSVNATSLAQNGDATVTVFAKALSPSKGEVSKTIDVRIFLCENPWPSITDFPYKDVDFNYDSFYCRDFGDPGTQDDLPPLSGAIKSSQTGDYLQESIFVVQ